MPLAGGDQRRVHGIHNSAITCCKRPVRLAVAGFEQPFDSYVFVSSELQPLYNLLGRDNFFVKFRVGFDQKDRKLILDDRMPR